MKTLSLVLLASLLAVNAFAAKEKTITIDPASSSITWLAKKIGGEHTGEVKLKDGNIAMDAGKITGGSFSIDMSTIVDKDLTDASYNAKLVGHLKSEDFFSVEKNPTVSFKITKVVAAKGKDGATHKITGDLTIKGITHAVTFPATVKADGKSFQAAAKITVDRTKYDIKYRSKNFFKDLGDKVIEDNFTIDLKLVSKN